MLINVRVYEISLVRSANQMSMNVRNFTCLLIIPLHASMAARVLILLVATIAVVHPTIQANFANLTMIFASHSRANMVVNV